MGPQLGPDQEGTGRRGLADDARQAGWTPQQLAPDEEGTGQRGDHVRPLRLGLGGDRDDSARAAAAAKGSPRGRSPADAPDGHLKPPAKPQKGIDVTSPVKHKSPLRIPPLLSPTLPKILEEELELLGYKGTPSKSDSSQRISLASDSPRSAKKARTAGELNSSASARKPTLLVTLKYKKKNAKRVVRLLALHE